MQPSRQHFTQCHADHEGADEHAGLGGVDADHEDTQTRKTQHIDGFAQIGSERAGSFGVHGHYS